MIIHVVMPGQTLYSVASSYGVSPDLLGQMNQLEGDRLAVGQTLVVYEDAVIHTVRQGETLYSIAEEEGLTLRQLRQYNYFLGGEEDIKAGQKLVVALPGRREADFAVNGYAYPFISPGLLREELPYLSAMTPFTYGFTPAGELVSPGEEALLTEAKKYDVIPWLHLSTWTGSRFDSDLGAAMLEDSPARENLFANIARTVQEKGYRGVDVDFEYLPTDRGAAYAGFIAALRAYLRPLDCPVLVALAPKTYAAQPGLLYEAHDYAALSAAADGVLLMTYEWGYTFGPPMAVAPLPQVEKVLSYALTEMPPSKIFLGIPTYGYDWPLPYEKGKTRATSLSPTQAVSLALEYGAEIQYDALSQVPWFSYADAQGVEHEVWFEDARSVLAKLELASRNGLRGLGLWSLMRRFPQFYLVLAGKYEILPIQ